MFRSVSKKLEVFALVLAAAGAAFGQTSGTRELVALDQQRSPIKSSDTQVRLPALFTVKEIGYSSTDSKVKLEALNLLREPVGSGVDNIRFPALYAIADIAETTNDQAVKQFALESLLEPFRSNTLAVRIAAIDALNSILTQAVRDEKIVMAALNLLYQPADSGNNAARMPAVNAIWKTVHGTGLENAYSRALELLENPIHSRAAVGGMEIRFVTIEAIERIGVEAKSTQVKRKALDLLNGLPSTDTSRGEAARARILETM